MVQGHSYWMCLAQESLQKLRDVVVPQCDGDTVYMTGDSKKPRQPSVIDWRP